MTLLTIRAREWIAWAVNVHLDLAPPLREAHVVEILEPRFGTDLSIVLAPWPEHLHPLILSSVTRELRVAAWATVRAADPSPPPLERRA